MSPVLDFSDELKKQTLLVRLTQYGRFKNVVRFMFTGKVMLDYIYVNPEKALYKDYEVVR